MPRSRSLPLSLLTMFLALPASSSFGQQATGDQPSKQVSAAPAKDKTPATTDRSADAKPSTPKKADAKPTSVKAGEKPKEAAKAEEEKQAAKEPAAGHSYHGEAFNEGPRQKARILGGTGAVRFPVNTKSDAARQFLLQGVGQLHGFWYFEAERSFRQAAFHDPDNPIAYWGMAMANFNNEKRAKGFIAQAVKHKANATRYETLWIDAVDKFLNPKNPDEKVRRLAFVRDLEVIIDEFPDEIETKAFLARFIWENSSKGLDINSHAAVDALIQQVLAVEPMHPIHHYRIHLWDKEKAARALTSAAKCGPSAPTIAHMWHMPGHIYDKLHRYSDAVWQQEASARADHRNMIEQGIMPYAIFNYAHNNEWLVRGLNHLGSVQQAIAVSKNLLEVPRHPQHNSLENNSSCAAYGHQRLLETLVRYEMWEELLALEATPYLEASEYPVPESARLLALGRANLAQGDIAKAKQRLAAIAPLRERLVTDRDKAVEDAKSKATKEAEEKAKKEADEKLRKEQQAKSDKPQEKTAKAEKKADDKAAAKQDKPKEKIKKAADDAAKPFVDKIKDVDAAKNELELWIAVAEGRKEDAGKKLGELKELFPSLRARAYLSLGDSEKAIQEAKLAVTSKGAGQVEPLATQVEILYRANKKDEALTAFGKLRTLAGKADLQAPIFTRLAPIAKEAGMPADWRTQAAIPKDIGDRPALAQLGPLHWTPSPAPQWKLHDADGKTVALADYKGKPVIALFYLGYGCIHCIEQLNTFAPMAKDYNQAGIAIVGISSDTPSGLKETLKQAKTEGGFPFPIVADSSLDVFQHYRAYDDFERMPLHGTFLIDGDGLIRWQDIGPEPFADAKFLLGEAQRLLRLRSTSPRS